jgi:GMP synthase-like glutamine amidotransferase
MPWLIGSNNPIQHSIIARSEECDILAFKVKDRPVWGIQPHFEMGIVEGLKYIDHVIFAEAMKNVIHF